MPFNQDRWRHRLNEGNDWPYLDMVSWINRICTRSVLVSSRSSYPKQTHFLQIVIETSSISHYSASHFRSNLINVSNAWPYSDQSFRAALLTCRLRPPNTWDARPDKHCRTWPARRACNLVPSRLLTRCLLTVDQFEAPSEIQTLRLRKNKDEPWHSIFFAFL